MKKYILGLAAVVLGISLSSCGTKENEGTFTYSYDAIPEMELLDSYSYQGVYFTMNEIEKRKSIFNVENVRNDLFTGENSYLEKSDYFSGSYSHLEWENDFSSAGQYIDDRKDMYVIKNLAGFESLILDNPDRYLSVEYLSDLKKLEKDEITIEDFTDIYGDHYAYRVIITNYLSARLTFTPVNEDVDASCAEEIWNTVFGYEDSLEKKNNLKKLMKDYNIEMHVAGTVHLENYEDYEAYRDTEFANKEYYSLVYSAWNGQELLFPREGYSHAQSLYDSYIAWHNAL